jgi:hypothetical protein
MNQTFNFQRFLLTLRLEIAAKGRVQMMMAGLLVALLLVLMLPITVFNGLREIMSLLHALAVLMVVLFGGSLYTGLAFNQYGSSDTGMAALMVPASRLEKFLSALLLNLLFVVPFIIFFRVLEDWTIDYANAKLPATDYKYNKIPLPILRYITSFYVVIQGVTLLGSLYFTKSSYVKTAIAFSVVLLGVAAANLIIVYSLTAYSSPSWIFAFPFASWDVSYYRPMYKVYHADFSENLQNLMYGVPLLIILSLWYITYVRLKEKEI